jgi:hypothetical protein
MAPEGPKIEQSIPTVAPGTLAPKTDLNMDKVRARRELASYFAQAPSVCPEFAIKSNIFLDDKNISSTPTLGSK